MRYTYNVIPSHAHTYPHTPAHKHTPTHRHTHTDTHLHMPKYTHSHIHTQTYTRKHTRTHTSPFTLPSTHTHTHTQARTRTHSHTHKHAHTDTQRHARMHTCTYLLAHTPTHPHTYIHTHHGHPTTKASTPSARRLGPPPQPAVAAPRPAPRLGLCTPPYAFVNASSWPCFTCRPTCSELSTSYNLRHPRSVIAIAQASIAINKARLTLIAYPVQLPCSSASSLTNLLFPHAVAHHRRQLLFPQKDPPIRPPRTPSPLAAQPPGSPASSP